MSEPERLAQYQTPIRPQAQPQGASQLPDAPALRNLAFLATGLTVAAVVLAAPALRDQGASLPAASVVAPAPAPAAAPVTVAQAQPAPATTPAAAPTTASAPPAPLHSPAKAASAAAPPPAVHVPAAQPPPALPTVAPAQPPPQALASAAPQAQPVPQSNAACLVDARLLRTPYPQGVVVGFEDRATSEARIRSNEANTGGVINPSYFANPRAKVKTPGGNVYILIVPGNMSVKVGDRVTVQSGYRDMSMACGYVPPLITGDLGPAPPQTPPATPVTPGGQPPAG
ncbi:hypothetical protein [Phenylobacterium sp.]|uniref:hypothetical protein n=1 Tax=Phenylobacterium sp. TaxID=1871053 RepID=UPI002CA45ECB|nr:hypothetical protein [Phenylobacterium sp.]HLZ76053.1 hypothetical protein [Phenylobacterium sp.]